MDFEEWARTRCGEELLGRYMPKVWGNIEVEVEEVEALQRVEEVDLEEAEEGLQRVEVVDVLVDVLADEKLMRYSISAESVENERET